MDAPLNQFNKEKGKGTNLVKPFAFKPTQVSSEFRLKLPMPLHPVSVVFALALLIIGTAAAAKAQLTTAGTIVYTNFPRTIPPNVFSQGASAYNFTELGDGLTLASGGTLDTVTVLMQSWACQSGNWQNASGPDACVTSPNATYSIPVTVNIYSVVSGGTSLEGTTNQPAPETLLGTSTQTFAIRYRPSSDFVNCPASAPESSGGYYEFYDSVTQACGDGINVPITFNLSSLKIHVPNQIIVTFSYNTSTNGPSPLGLQACYGTTAGCFYDSLNISGGAGAAAFPGAIIAPTVGSVLSVTGIVTRFPNSDTALCGTGTAPANTLALDASPGCYTGDHPMIQVTIK